ncbi:type I phosphodiesterase/nucleotide pyrophosphatase [Solidesulfovibrio carbinoliphilus subsp. oakridgensis]|uniref:Type I phosphodiesterase/nucleotide pyrophosphatase n=1 Tax=Solidesulfovibrio carbinoliphilus subsp. oakridgensis TaxID=694327 RepID=G7Q3S8_9BACT|nr:alkaline phosphatase family protein [Solidesulfovibrio carbinoliphilus]EHJ46718.1 type I phosphodiesterase/nucleotide pyrophosphatase [Solidesulfovibrio carbinoliphilus subsp. oakridgensis]
MHSRKTFRKTLVLGIDGLDPGLTRRLMGQGHLPHLEKLSQKGVMSDLLTANPAQSPVAWTCLATGANPGVHGIFDFIVRDPATCLPRLSLTRTGPGGRPEPAYDAPTFFEVAARAGLPATAVRWPVTYPPAYAGVKVLSGLGAPDVMGRLGNYVQYIEEGRQAGGGRGRFETVRFADGRATVSVNGPVAVVAGKRTPARVALELLRGEGRLAYVVCGQTGRLEAGQWSPYLTLDFDLGQGRRVSGVTRLLPTSLDPLELYCGPIQVDPRNPSLPVASPAGYAAELAQALGGSYSTLGMPEETKGLTDGVVTDEAFLTFCEEVTREREAMLDHELHRFREGLLSVVFDTSDRIQHCFWRLHDPAHPLYDAAAAKRLGPVIENHLVRMDAVVGRAMEAAGDDTALFVCSDHGFCSYDRSVNLNAWLAEAGYLKLKPHDPVDPGELFRHVDWSATRAYALGFGSIYLNVAGRERNGMVAPGEASRALAEEIAGRLETLVDAGKPVVAAVHRKETLYKGPLTDQAPDLVVGYRPPYRVAWTSAIGGTGPGIFTDNRQKWSGDHCVDASFVPGTLFSNLPLAIGPAVPQTRLAATVCRALGLEPDGHMEPDLLSDHGPPA